MTYTTHGHHIQGTPTEPFEGPRLNNCDGPGDCVLCSEEAAVELTKIVDELHIRARHGQKHQVKIVIEQGDDPELWPGGMSRHTTTLSCACGSGIIEQTIVDRAYADKDFLRELAKMQTSAVERLHRLHINAATRRRL